MNKKYRLKPYDSVEYHHFIEKSAWDKLASATELSVEFLGDALSDTALICPVGVEKTIANAYLVSRSDLYVVKDTPTNNAKSNKADIKEKTYTKDDIRKAGMRVVECAEGETEAVAYSLAIAKLINELN